MRKRTKAQKGHEPVSGMVEEVSELSADNVATAVVAEEPLPVVIAEMALWGAGISVLLIPIGIMGMCIAPFAAVGNVFRPAPQTA